MILPAEAAKSQANLLDEQRQAAEAARIDAELKAEESRQEQALIAADIARQEQKRIVAEQELIAAEEERIAAEHVLIAAEEERIAAEQEAKTLADKQENHRQLVKSIQLKLTDLGYEPGIADGIPGAGTKQAIKYFQQTNALPITGTISQNLLSALNSPNAMANSPLEEEIQPTDTQIAESSEEDGNGSATNYSSDEEIADEEPKKKKGFLKKLGSSFGGIFKKNSD